MDEQYEEELQMAGTEPWCFGCEDRCLAWVKAEAAPSAGPSQERLPLSLYFLNTHQVLRTKDFACVILVHPYTSLQGLGEVGPD